MITLIENHDKLGSLDDPRGQGDEVKAGKRRWLTRGRSAVPINLSSRSHRHFPRLQIHENVHKIARYLADVVTRNCVGQLIQTAKEALNLAWLWCLHLPDTRKIGFAVGSPRRGRGKVRLAILGSRNPRSWVVQPLRSGRHQRDG